MDAQSWYNKSVPPAERAYQQTLYDRLLLEEIYPRVSHETGHGRIATAGCSRSREDRMKPKLRVVQIVSGIGRPEKKNKILKGLGLRGPNREVVVDNTPAFRGMIKKILHLVTVEETDG